MTDIDFGSNETPITPSDPAQCAWLAIAAEFQLSVREFGQDASCSIADDGRLVIGNLKNTETSLLRKNIDTVRRVVRRDSLPITGLRFI